MCAALDIDVVVGNPSPGVEFIGFAPRNAVQVASDYKVYSPHDLDALAAASSPRADTTDIQNDNSLRGLWYDILHEACHAALLREGLLLDQHEESGGALMALEHALVRTYAPYLRRYLQTEHGDWGIRTPAAEAARIRQLPEARHKSEMVKVALKLSYRGARTDASVATLFFRANLSTCYAGERVVVSRDVP